MLLGNNKNSGGVALFVLFLVEFFLPAPCFAYPMEMVVCLPVANLYKKPGVDLVGLKGPQLSQNVFGLETQLLFGEHVTALEEKSIDGISWVRVVAQEQKKIKADVVNSFPHTMGYPGWMLASSLVGSESSVDKKTPFFIKELWVNILSGDRESLYPFGCRFFMEKVYPIAMASEVLLFDGRKGLLLGDSLDAGLGDRQGLLREAVVRKKLVRNAKCFLGSPYVWGGCSPFKADADFLTGVDCSGLIYLSYRVCGCEIPRDAHDQFCFLRETEPKNMRLGDLIFWGKERECSGKKELFMNHVAMFVGDETFIQARGNPHHSDINDMAQGERDKLCVCLSSSEELFGKSVYDLKNGEQLPATGKFVFCRSYFSQRTIQSLQ